VRNEHTLWDIAGFAARFAGCFAATLVRGFGPGFFLAGLGGLSSSLSSTSETFVAVFARTGFFLGGGVPSKSEVSEATSDLRFADRVLRVGITMDGGNSSSEGGAMGVGEGGNSKGRDSEWAGDSAGPGLDAGRGSAWAFKAASSFLRFRAVASEVLLGAILGIQLLLGAILGIQLPLGKATRVHGWRQ
jgi:hypothetical protein